MPNTPGEREKNNLWADEQTTAPKPASPLRPKVKLRITSMFRFLGGMLLVIMLLETVWMLLGNLSLKPVVAQWGTIEKGFWTEALFLRQEALLISPRDGYFIPRVDAGEWMPLGEILAYVHDKKEILLPESELQGQAKIDFWIREKESLERELKRVGAEIVVHIRRKNSAKEDLESLKKEQAWLFDAIARLRKNIEQKSAAVSGGNFPVSITAPFAGYVYFQTDGWEEQMASERFAERNSLDWRRNYPLKQPEERVQEGEVLGKVIHPRQIITIRIDPERIGEPSREENWWWKKSEQVYKLTVKNMIPLPDGKKMVALEDTSGFNDFMPQRRANIYLIYRRISGICVPVHALFQRDGKPIVKLLHGNRIEEKEVIIGEKGDSHAVVTGIEVGTVLVSR